VPGKDPAASRFSLHKVRDADGGEEAAAADALIAVAHTGSDLDGAVAAHAVASDGVGHAGRAQRAGAKRSYTFALAGGEEHESEPPAMKRRAAAGAKRQGWTTAHGAELCSLLQQLRTETQRGLHEVSAQLGAMRAEAQAGVQAVLERCAQHPAAAVSVEAFEQLRQQVQALRAELARHPDTPTAAVRRGGEEPAGELEAPVGGGLGI
jgi:hypothetical protein